MKFKFLNAALAGLLLTVSCVINVANAALIVNTIGLTDLQWADTALSKDLRRAQVESMLNGPTALNGYRYASLSEVSLLYKHMLSTITPAPLPTNYNNWLALNNQNTGLNLNDDWDMFFGFVQSSSLSNNINFSASTFTGQLIAQRYMMTRIFFGADGECNPNPFNSCYNFNDVMYGRVQDPTSPGGVKFEVTGFFNYPDSNIWGKTDLGPNQFTSKNNNFNAQNNTQLNIMHYLVKDVEKVPEPSTLAIFALGMIGLASRRFKKQS